MGWSVIKIVIAGIAFVISAIAFVHALKDLFKK